MDRPFRFRDWRQHDGELSDLDISLETASWSIAKRIHPPNQDPWLTKKGRLTVQLR